MKLQLRQKILIVIAGAGVNLKKICKDPCSKAAEVAIVAPVKMPVTERHAYAISQLSTHYNILHCGLVK
ncbi:hypothetical protein [uncultured Desulfovibrio sp.]|uniref:hypothetical protein n=1 Tax=uncultured Desulfovibrio sp. TaxID=167968 RepID=UPI00260CF8D7|nr:hypothetical protein [uncultured Desulfovibrio sp.]